LEDLKNYNQRRNSLTGGTEFIALMRNFECSPAHILLDIKKKGNKLQILFNTIMN